MPNNYTISFERITRIEEQGEDPAISEMKFNFMSIPAICAMETGLHVDLCARVTDVSGKVQITTKSGDEVDKRTLILVDETGYSIELTLWGETSNNPMLENLA